MAARRLLARRALPPYQSRGPWPDRLRGDLGDGQGAPAAIGEPVRGGLRRGRAPVVGLRCITAARCSTARFALAISDDPAPPVPDETWPLKARAATGASRARPGARWCSGRRSQRDRQPGDHGRGLPRRSPLRLPVRAAQPAGHRRALHGAGYDLVIVGLDNGMTTIEAQRGRADQGIREARRRTPQPLVVGGVSMGGLISRIALAQMEKHREPHDAAPTSASTRRIAGPTPASGCSGSSSHCVRSPGLGAFAVLFNAPSNQQLMIEWLDEGLVGRARCAIASSWTSRPSAAIPSSHASWRSRAEDGGGGAVAGAPALGGRRQPFASAQLNTLPGSRQDRRGGDVVPRRAAAGAARLRLARAWDTVPGSQNSYNARSWRSRRASAAGASRPPHPQTCCIPTVSALDLDQDPLAPVGEPRAVRRFDCSAENVEHLVLTADVSKWIVDGARARAERAAGGACVEPRRLRPASAGVPQRSLSDVRALPRKGARLLRSQYQQPVVLRLRGLPGDPPRTRHS